MVRLDPPDRHDRHADLMSDGRQAAGRRSSPAARAWWRSGSGPGTQVRGTGSNGLLRLGRGVHRGPQDRRGAEQPARLGDGQVLLPKVGPIGCHGERDVHAVVDDEPRPRLRHRREVSSRELVELPVGAPLGAQLHERHPGPEDGVQHAQRARHAVTGFVVCNEVEACQHSWLPSPA